MNHAKRAAQLFASVSAGADPVMISPGVVLEEGPNCSVLLRELLDGSQKWKVSRIQVSGDRRLVAAVRRSVSKVVDPRLV